MEPWYDATNEINLLISLNNRLIALSVRKHFNMPVMMSPSSIGDVLKYLVLLVQISLRSFNKRLAILFGN